MLLDKVPVSQSHSWELGMSGSGNGAPGKTRAGGFFIVPEAHPTMEGLSRAFQCEEGRGIGNHFSSLSGRIGVSACYH